MTTMYSILLSKICLEFYTTYHYNKRNILSKGWEFPDSSVSKESACSARAPGSIPGSGRSPGEGMTTLSSILAWKYPIDRGAWRAPVHGVARVQYDLATKPAPQPGDGKLKNTRKKTKFIVNNCEKHLFPIDLGKQIQMML